MTNLIKIENINHRLGNDTHYFMNHGEVRLLFTPHEIKAARERYERAIRRRPTVGKLFESVQDPVKKSIWARVTDLFKFDLF